METRKNILANEAEIAAKAKTDEAAFEVLYNHYFPRIFGYIFKRLGNREASEDILSSTFLKAFTNLKKYQSRGFSFGAWLYRIATNNLMDYYRRQKPGMEVELEEANAGELSGADPAAVVAQKQERAVIEKVLNQMPARYREVIQLRYFAELEIEEIAGALKISKVHASVLIHRALNKFKSECKDKFEI
jgi:RNA polymerase sigma-70 factor, ECF subfamily